MPRFNHGETLAEKRKKRVRGKIFGTSERPRLTVFRSNKNTYLQVINDEAGQTVAAANNLSLEKAKVKLTGTKIEQAVTIAKHLAKQLADKKIKAIRFDRGSYKYHGRLKAIADHLREAGIEV